MQSLIAAQFQMKLTMADWKLPVLTLTVLLCLSTAQSELLTKCKSDDTKCVKESAVAFTPKFAAGLPEYGVKKLDPIFFKKIDASSPNLKLIVTDVTITGMKDCVPKKIKRVGAKNKLYVKLLCSCQLEGQYEMKGQLLILPIEGKGPLHVTLRKAELNIDADVGEMEKNGDKYWDVKGWKHTFSLNEKSDVVFENLFNGNEVLSQAAREVISSSGNDIIYEVGAPVIKAAVDEVIENVKTFFHQVPAKELSLDY